MIFKKARNHPGPEFPKQLTRAVTCSEIAWISITLFGCITALACRVLRETLALAVISIHFCLNRRRNSIEAESQLISAFYSVPSSHGAAPTAMSGLASCLGAKEKIAGEIQRRKKPLFFKQSHKSILATSTA